MKRIWYSEIGGIFVGTNIKTGFVSNRMHSIIVSEEGAFRLEQYAGKPWAAEAILVSPNVRFRIETGQTASIACIHIDPYSEIGLTVRNNREVAALPRSELWKSLVPIFSLPSVGFHDEGNTENVLRSLVEALPPALRTSRKLDERITQCIRLINTSESVALSELARACSLSLSRLSHLFKAETGITLRQYAQHRKMIGSIHGLHNNMNYTHAAFHGGFSDQPHFNNVFKRMFGIRPKSTDA